MKTLLKLAALCALVFALLAPAPARAQHALLGTYWSSTDHTNVAGFATNIATSVDCNRHQYINLEFVIGLTNASAATMSVVWQTGNTTSTLGESGNGATGWFSVPLTNGGTVINWNTNIDVGRARYFHISYITNASVQHVTNASVKAYIKRL